MANRRQDRRDAEKGPATTETKSCSTSNCSSQNDASKKLECWGKPLRLGPWCRRGSQQRHAGSKKCPYAIDEGNAHFAHASCQWKAWRGADVQSDASRSTKCCSQAQQHHHATNQRNIFSTTNTTSRKLQRHEPCTCTAKQQQQRETNGHTSRGTTTSSICCCDAKERAAQSAVPWQSSPTYPEAAVCTEAKWTQSAAAIPTEPHQRKPSKQPAKSLFSCGPCCKHACSNTTTKRTDAKCHCPSTTTNSSTSFFRQGSPSKGDDAQQRRAKAACIRWKEIHAHASRPADASRTAKGHAETLR
mmetsp:Transcript_10067/g.19959  ORF Transcript_10067/g.19959 Transcript_10067/m.19959 type:complete len:302 (-) Transcript_10067:384-1289(-)